MNLLGSEQGDFSVLSQPSTQRNFLETVPEGPYAIADYSDTVYSTTAVG